MNIPIADQKLFKLCSNPELVDFEYIKEIPSHARVGNDILKVDQSNGKYLNNLGYFTIVASQSERRRTNMIKSIIDSQKNCISGGLLVSFEVNPPLESVFPHSCIHRDLTSMEDRITKIVQHVKEMEANGTPIYPIIVFHNISVKERKFLDSYCNQLIFNGRHLGIKFIVSVNRIHEISKRSRLQAQCIFSSEIETQTVEGVSELDQSEIFTLNCQLSGDEKKIAKINYKGIELCDISNPDIATMGSDNFWKLHHIYAKEKSNPFIPFSNDPKPQGNEEKKTKIFDEDILNFLSRYVINKMEDITVDILRQGPKEGDNILKKVATLLNETPTEHDAKSREIQALKLLNEKLSQENNALNAQCNKLTKENELMMKEVTELNETLEQIYSIAIRMETIRSNLNKNE